MTDTREDLRNLGQARDMLHAWAKAHAKSDEVVRAAHAAGITASEIQRTTGIARTTLARILHT